MKAMQPAVRTATMRGQWLALTAALLGWMFDGFEMGLFPLVARPALRDLLGSDAEKGIALWQAVATAGFLVGAATGGVLFGWLGDRVGRVRAMTLSVFTYAVFSGLCGFATEAWQVAVLRFVSALGMGGEWSLGVALVMELWPNRSRALLAGLIGAAANLGYLVAAALGLGLSLVRDRVGGWLLAVGMSSTTADWLTAESGWRLLMMMGAAPALLTLFIRLFVPESHRWEEEKRRGGTSHWATVDLLGVVVGALAAAGLIALWTLDVGAFSRQYGTALTWVVFAGGSLLAVTVATVAYLYPVMRYLQRGGAAGAGRASTSFILRRMLLGATLSGIPLLATWAAVQWGPTWADQLTGSTFPQARGYTQLWSSVGAILGTIAAALLADWIGRRFAYVLMCLGSLASLLLFYKGNTAFNAQFLAMACLVGFMSASFYGWLPLYLPELFPTRVRATGQGFSFNFGRIIASIGVMVQGMLVGLFGGNYPLAGSIMSVIYVVGVVVIWLAPETKGRPLPD